MRYSKCARSEAAVLESHSVLDMSVFTSLALIPCLGVLSALMSLALSLGLVLPVLP
jgi:hypothetical protein